MGVRVASGSDFAQLQKTANKNLEGVSQWERYFLQPLQESVEAAEKQITAQTSYDISSAYANYKKQQLNLLQNQALGTGFKEQVGSQLQSEYQTAFAEAQVEGASRLQSLQQQYQKTLAEEESRLLERGQQFADIEKIAYEFGGVDVSKLEDLGYYENINGVYQITDAGIDYFDKIFNQGKIVKDEEGKEVVKRFSDYLYDTDPELYEFYAQNIGDVREMVGGLSRSDATYNPEERAYKLELEALNKEMYDFVKENNYAYMVNSYKLLKNRDMSNWTDSQRLNYYKQEFNTMKDMLDYEKNLYRRGKTKKIDFD